MGSALMSRLNDVEIQVHPGDFARFDLDRTPAVIAQEALLQNRLDLVFPRRQRRHDRPAGRPLAAV